MSNKMLIDAAHPEETRVVVLKGNRVEDFDFESASKKPLRGNIYLAKVTRVEPSLQAAFVEYGGNRHGFLAFSEIHPDYYQIPVADRQALLEDEARAHREEDDEQRNGGQRRSRRHRRHGSSEKRTAQSDESVSETADEADERLDPAEFSSADSAVDEGAERADTTSQSYPDAASEPLLPFNATEAATGEPYPAGDTDQPAAAEATVEASAVTTASESELFEQSEAAEVSEPDPDIEAALTGEAGDELPAPAEEDRDEAVSSLQTSARQDALEARDADEHGGDLDNGDEGDAEEETVEQIGGDAMEDLPFRAPRLRRHYKIQEVIKRRQILLVQVVKEERGNKGAALTTYLSLAGRYSVLMPNTARGGGISRKITDSDDRKRLKSIAQELEVPEGMGIILRTAGAARGESEVKRDFEYLLRMWETIRELTLRSSAPSLVYEEGSLIKRAIRDLFSREMEEIVVSGEGAYREAKDFMRLLMPSQVKNVRLYADTQPIFAKSGVEAQLDAMFSNHVTLRSGGYIVMNQTEALVAIDVNSGRSTREHNIEDTALRTNLEAADEVARQLRLRDLAGLIVVDFIDMEEGRNNRAVERRLKEALKNDRARIQIGRISHFGLLEMSRQRIRTGVLEGSTVMCPHCAGAGTVRSTSSISLHVLRVLEDTLIRSAEFNLIVRTRMEVALYMLNQKRAHLSDLEQRFGVTITVMADPTLTGTVYHALERGELATRAAIVAPRAAIETGAIEEEQADLDAELSSEDEDRDETMNLGADRAGEEGELGAEASERRKRRRRRRRGRDRDGRGPAATADGEQPSDAGFDGLTSEAEESAGETPSDEVLPEFAASEPEPVETAMGVDVLSEPILASTEESAGPPAEAEPAEAGEPSRRRRSRRSRASDAETSAAATDEEAPAPRRSRRSRSRASEEETPNLLGFTAQPEPSQAETPAEASEEPAPTTAPADQALTPVASEPAAAVPAENPAPASVAAEPAPPAVSEPPRPKRSGWWQRAKATLTGE